MFVFLKNVEMSRWLLWENLVPLCIFKSRNVTDFEEISHVNLILWWQLFRFFRKWSSCSRVPVQIHIISSIYYFHNAGFTGCFCRKFLSRQSINRFA